jgi:predicted DNA-binding protein with PD1-like motif
MISMNTAARPGKRVIGRLEKGDDLLAGVTEFCRKNHISAGTVNVIGAVRKAALGYYDQKRKAYDRPIKLKKALELASCSGNISMKDNAIFLHLHAVFSDKRGRTFGGHVLPGTVVFAAEFSIQELIGADLIRMADPGTGLSLWK